MEKMTPQIQGRPQIFTIHDLLVFEWISDPDFSNLRLSLNLWE